MVEEHLSADGQEEWKYDVDGEAYYNDKQVDQSTGVDEGGQEAVEIVNRWTDWDMDDDGKWVCQTQANSDIAAFSTEEIDSRVYVRHVPNKGRCLFTRYALKPGDVIFVEEPILSCTTKSNKKLWKAIHEDCELHNTEMDMPASWHFAALYSLLYLDKKNRKQILDKWHPTVNPQELSTDVLRICRNVSYAKNVDPFEYERMLHAWRYNCFGHHSDNNGLVCYNRISMMAHCCESSATWHYGTSNDQFVLRARRHLEKDDEITITYVGDEELYKSKDLRRTRLASWLFTCRCNKCSTVLDASRGLRCPSCGGGVVYLTTDDEYSVLDGTDADKKFSASNCSSCRYKMNQEEIATYVGFETAYINRLELCNVQDLGDCETVLLEAGRVFIQHFVLFELHTKLQEAYKVIGDYDLANYYLDQRIKFVEQACPSPSYHLAWLYEELGDNMIAKHLQERGVDLGMTYWEVSTDGAPKLDLSLGLKNRIVRAYESAMNIFLASCGDSHTYTLTSHWKMEFILAMDGKVPMLPVITEEGAEEAEESKQGE